MKRCALPLLSLLGGAGCFILRLLQNRSGFEPDTGLPIPGHPLAYVLPATLLLLAAAAALLTLRYPSEKGDSPLDFRAHFVSGSTGTLVVTVCGVFFWFLSGVAGLLPGLTGGAAVSPTPVPGLYLPADPSAQRTDMVLGVLTIASALALLPAVAVCRRGGKRVNIPARLNGNLLLLPVVALVVRLAFSYREMSVNASQQIYYAELLALVLLVLALFRLSSFAFQCGNTRRFLLYASLSVIFCLTALADVSALSGWLFFGGGAALAMGFMLLRLSAPEIR